ncbi:MAG: amidohydrolase [Janthinobacterium lividum]
MLPSESCLSALTTRFIALICCFAGILPISAQQMVQVQQPVPDTLFIHGNILTGTRLRANDADPVPGRVTAMAVRGDLILAVGTDASMLALKDPQTKVIDLHGAFAMPGFNDAHTHMAMAGQQRLAVNLIGTRSVAEMQDRIRRYVASARPGQWILGGGWDHTLWASKTLPTRQELDAVTAGHPALLDRVDGHIAVVNTAALHIAGLTGATPNPKGGAFDRGTDGELTGIIRETPALAVVREHIPKPDTETRTKALNLSIQDALAHGVTSVQDFSDWEDWLVLESLEQTGKLPLRFAEWIDFNLPIAVLEQRRASHVAADPLLHLTQLKGFMDGSLGSRTAALEEPYADDPENAGLPRYEAEKLEQMATERARAGFQLGFHAIGDRANDMALDAFEAAEQAGKPAACAGEQPCPAATDGTIVCSDHPCEPVPDFRYRIEHAQVVTPGAFDRFARLHVIASMQPSHLLTDMAWASQRLGPERSTRAYAWRSFLDHGVTLAFGTDYPVESISPFRGLYSAVTRQNEAGTQTFQPQQRLTIHEAIYAYTQASAYAEFRDRLKGRLEPGYLADFVVLDRDITTVPPRSLLDTVVLRTVVGGVTRYEANQSSVLPRAMPLGLDAD